MRFAFSPGEKKWAKRSLILGIICLTAFWGVPKASEEISQYVAECEQNEKEKKINDSAVMCIRYIDCGANASEESPPTLDFSVFRERRARVLAMLNARIDRAVATGDTDSGQMLQGVRSIVEDFCPTRFEQHRGRLVQDTKENYIFLTTLQEKGADVPTTQPQGSAAL